jgi:hypothetical protein
MSHQHRATGGLGSGLVIPRSGVTSNSVTIAIK